MLGREKYKSNKRVSTIDRALVAEALLTVWRMCGSFLRINSIQHPNIAFVITSTVTSLKNVVCITVSFWFCAEVVVLFVLCPDTTDVHVD